MRFRDFSGVTQLVTQKIPTRARQTRSTNANAMTAATEVLAADGPPLRLVMRHHPQTAGFVSSHAEHQSCREEQVQCVVSKLNPFVSFAGLGVAIR